MPECHPVLLDINVDDPLAFGGGQVIEHRHAGCGAQDMQVARCVEGSEQEEILRCRGQLSDPGREDGLQPFAQGKDVGQLLHRGQFPPEKG
jgi:hypothetical protein